VGAERVFSIHDALVFHFPRSCHTGDISPRATTLVHAISILFTLLLHVSIHHRAQARCAAGGKRER
jgi:hypothetical protein